MTQASVARGQRLGTEQHEHGAHDAGAREDDLGPVGLQPGDPAPLERRAAAVEVDLALDLVQAEPAPVDGARVVGLETEPYRDEVGDRAAHADHRLRRVVATQASELAL